MNETSIADLSFEFAIEILKLYRFLVAAKEFVLSRQLLRSGRSIGATCRRLRLLKLLVEIMEG